jgi:hypothetical protein
MSRMKCLDAKRILIAALMSLFLAEAGVTAQAENDPHRPACTDAHCRKIKSFLRSHYCGESPAGNGPDDGCEIKLPTTPQAAVEVIAAYKCEWNEHTQGAQCEQRGQPSSVVRAVLTRELQQLGLPANAKGQTFFTVWKSTSSGWTLATADYSRSIGSDIELCQVIVTIDQNSHVLVLRKLPFQKTDIDVPTVTQWSPIDLADIDGDGKADVVLEGDAYENHWLEVVSVRDGSAKTVFSGLGYWL